MFTVKMAKAGFFDRAAVINAVDRATLKVFKEFGRLVRKGAQKSLVYSDKVSSPGSPPHAHKSNTITRISKSTGKKRIRSVSFLREFIFFVFDKSSRSVVIGPTRLANTMSPESLPALEYGGTSTILDHGKSRRVNVAARPFMGPAFEAEKPGLPAMWANSVR